MSSDNPLLSIPFAIPFDRIRPEHVEPAMQTLLANARTAIDAIAAGERTYEGTLGALERATEPLEVAMTVVGHLESVVSTPALREVFNKVEPEVSAFFASIPLNAGLWQALQAFAATDEARSLDPTRRRFLDKTLADFRRHGAGLDAAGKKRLEELSRELATLTTRFSQNVLDATSSYELVIEDEARLAGLPASARAAARAAAEEKGVRGYRFTLHAPSLTPVLTYLEDEDIRERLYLAHNLRGAEPPADNRPLVPQILALRRERARLLGYKDFADLVLEDRMAHDGNRAEGFIADLTERTRPHFERENQKLLEFRRREGNQGEMKPWDVGLWAEKQRRALYDFDEEELRPYFPVEKVVAGLWELVHRLYGIRVEERTDLPVWHPAVRTYAIRDEGGAELSSFYMDLFPRDEKRGGAWMNGLLTGTAGRPHLGLVCANLTPPLGGKPALLNLREVETLFHEFGHLLHHALSRVPVRSLAGTNVAWDFVELPSQIMENWVWEREAQPDVPVELWQKLWRARTYRAANAMMRQLGFAYADLHLHRTWDAARDGDPVSAARRILQDYSPVPLPDEHAMFAAFTHLFGSSVGYAAGYYSYKWAEVLEADAFTRFKERGVFNREVGLAFRGSILEKGDSREAADLYREFMGREPSLEPLLERAGLVPGEAPGGVHVTQEIR